MSKFTTIAQSLVKNLDSRSFLYEEGRRRGYEEGKRDAEEPRYESVCTTGGHLYPVHLIPDPARGPGHFLCPECILTHPERTTDSLARTIDPYQQQGQLMRGYRREKLPDWHTAHAPATRLPNKGL